MRYSPAHLMQRLRRVQDGELLARPAEIGLRALELLQPPKKISTVECAEKYRLLPGQEAGAVVRYDRMRTPYNVGPMNSLDDPRCQLVVMVKPSRSGGTAVAENYLFKLIKFGPMTAVAWVLNSDEAVTDYSRNVLKPMFELNPDLLAQVGGDRGDNTDTAKRIAGYPVEWMSAKDSTFRNRQPGFMCLDETDAWAKKWASSPRVQIDGRQKMLGNRRKAAIMSHPDLGYQSGVAAAFEDTSRGIYVMTCPHCGGHAAAYATKYWDDVPQFKLSWTRNEELPTDERVALAEKSAALACPHNGCIITDAERRDMVDAALTRNDQSLDGWMHRGQLLDQERGVTGEPTPHTAHGFWVHGTMLKTQDIGKLARDYEQALIKFERTKDATALKEFLSKQMGEIFEGAATTGGLSVRVLKERVADAGYDRGTVPKQVRFITASVDPGRHKLDATFRGWDLEGRSWLIDRITVRSRRDDDGVERPLDLYGRQGDWEVLWETVLNKRFPIVGKPDLVMPVAVVVLDSSDGNATWKAREFARRAARSGYAWAGWSRLKLIKGQEGKRPILPETPTRIDKDERGQQVEPVLVEYRLGVDKLKEQTIERLATKPGEPGCCYFPREIETHYLEQYFGETKIDGKWVRNGPNETLDCFDVETELLTENGWVRFADLTRDCRVATVNLGSREIEYQWPTAYIARRYSGDMVQLKGRRLDILMTPNHRMVTMKPEWDQAKNGWNFDVEPKITLAKDLTQRHSLLMSAKWSGRAIEKVVVPEYISAQGRRVTGVVEVDAVAMAAFTGWFVAEGCLSNYVSKTQGNMRRRVNLSQNEGAKADKIRAVLAQLPWKFAERRNGKCVIFTAASAQLHQFMQDCGRLAENKRVPSWIKLAGPEVIRAFLDAAIDGDGWTQTKPGQRGHRTYATISPKLADDIQELFIKAGAAANITVRKGGKVCNIGSPDGRSKDQYHVSECKSATASLDTSVGGKRRYLGETVQYSGMVYCVTVPNGTLICRRNGKSFIAGNCDGYAEAGRLMLQPDRADIDWQNNPPEWATPISLSEKADGAQAQAVEDIFAMFNSLNED